MAIQSVNRAIDILSLFTVSQPRLGITEISNSLNLSKTTVHGLIKTLAQRGFLQQDPETRKYSLGFTIYEFGTRVSETLKINQISYGHASRLAQKTGQTIRVAVWDLDTILITLNVSSDLQNPYSQPSGIRVPAYCTALGKIILAHLPEKHLSRYLKKVEYAAHTKHTLTDTKLLLKELQTIKAKGYAEDREERFLGISCVAAAIFDHTGLPFASLSISGNETLLKAKNLSEMIHDMKLTATEISRNFGYIPSAV
ncbi:MAG: IclR family transcriptional regulator [Proteobacteria bacterium]|nr:IclR family transcriptional regulator [Pseudomonadota bacterium]